MPDLADGESAEMKGSGARPYVFENVGGVYSCTCPARRVASRSNSARASTCDGCAAMRPKQRESARTSRPETEEGEAADKAGRAGRCSPR